MVYPGQVIFEGTNISEGRGTTLPFEQFGAPFLDTDTIGKIAAKTIKGAVLRPVNFQPTSGKWQQQVCRGFHIHITSRKRFKPYLASLYLLQLIIKFHADAFEFKLPPYEYEYERKPIDLIIGSRDIREKITQMEDMAGLETDWQEELNHFRCLSENFYLYDKE
jgi:uncharacterized protein YbbC (DUF1343 family)